MVEAWASGFGIFLGLLVILLTGMTCDGKRSQTGCEPGWDSFKDKCYYAYKFPLYTYDEARTLCTALGGALAKINDVEEDLYLKGYTEGTVNLWLGANDRQNEEMWTWEDGTSMTYTNWKTGQPDNTDNVEHCLHFYDKWQAKWNDANCDFLMGFICEKETRDSACAVTAVGLESGGIPDSQITASSNYDNIHMSYQGRLNYAGSGSHAWCALQNIAGQWLQVDLGYERLVTKVATQGRGDCCDQWVKTFHLRYYGDGEWKYVTDENHSPMTFPGNSDANTIVYHDLVENSFTTQYVRFYPLTWEGHVAMRAEIYACE